MTEAASLRERLEKWVRPDDDSPLAHLLREAAAALASPAQPVGREEARSNLSEVVWEFVRDFGRDGRKVGRAINDAVVPIRRIEALRHALGTDYGASPPVAAAPWKPSTEAIRAANQCDPCPTHGSAGCGYRVGDPVPCTRQPVAAAGRVEERWGYAYRLRGRPHPGRDWDDWTEWRLTEKPFKKIVTDVFQHELVTLYAQPAPAVEGEPV